MGVKRVISQPGRAVAYAARRALRPAIIRHCGVRLAVDPDLLSPAIVDSLYRGGYEAAEVDIIRSTLTPDDRVLEVGGGIGFTGIIAAHIVRKPDDVLIVEANPQLIPLMERNFRLNGVRPTVRNAVLGKDGRTEVPFYIHRDFWASSLTAFKGARETKVPQQDVRTLFTEFRPTYVIVDIEGGEVDFFDDLELYGVEKICLEVHPGRTRRRRRALRRPRAAALCPGTDQPSRERRVLPKDEPMSERSSALGRLSVWPTVPLAAFQ